MTEDFPTKDQLARLLDAAIRLPEGAAILTFPKLKRDELEKAGVVLEEMGEERVLVTNFPEPIAEKIEGEAIARLQRLCELVDCNPAELEDWLRDFAYGGDPDGV